jgi:hypothetical protein
MAIVQIRHDCLPCLIRRRVAAGKTPMETLRALKRRLSDVVYPQLVADAGKASRETDRVVRLSIAGAHDADVVPAVREMATDFGLICYDPRSHAVWPSIPGYEPAISLWSMAGLRVPDPNSDRIHGAVKHLTRPYLGT